MFYGIYCRFMVMHISFGMIIIFPGNMSLNIPESLKKYCILAEDDTIIDMFKCPVPGCNFATRLGPGAVRMHVLIKADPMSKTRYSADHEEYWKEFESDLSMDNVRVLANIPHRLTSYRKP